MDCKINKKHIMLLGLFSLGVIFRYMVMTLGYNYDFESYCIVGEIASNFRNVYAETTRYNYAPIFLCIQGLLYRISLVKPDEHELIYRVLIVTVLTLTDLGITAFIAYRYSYLKALLFFLNPVSIIITGYHNQFDNIAVLFALLSSLYFNEERNFSKKDFGFIFMFTLSLLTKHILFLLPVFILLMRRLPFKKKVLYAFVPPTLFLLSFIPFALSSNEALQGIINNVFLYRSFNNAPLLGFIYKLINFPSEPRFLIYCILMVFTAWIVRERPYDQVIMIYLISMVTFSSAIANQYLAIPMAALCSMNVGKWKYIYMIVCSIFLFLDVDGFNAQRIIQSVLPGSIINSIGSLYIKIWYNLAAWILFFSLIHLYRKFRKGKSLIEIA